MIMNLNYAFNNKTMSHEVSLDYSSSVLQQGARSSIYVKMISEPLPIDKLFTRFANQEHLIHYTILYEFIEVYIV